MYALEFKLSVKKDFRKVSKADIAFIQASLYQFVEAFNFEYEQELLKLGKIKKLQGESEELYSLKLRRYRMIYKKEEEILVLLVLNVRSRESAYKKRECKFI